MTFINNHYYSINPIQAYVAVGVEFILKANLSSFEKELAEQSIETAEECKNYFKAGEQDFNANKIKDALKNYRKSIDALPTLSAYLNLGNCLIIISDFQKAKDILDIPDTLASA